MKCHFPSFGSRRAPTVLILSVLFCGVTIANDDALRLSPSGKEQRVSFAILARNILDRGKQESSMVNRYWCIQPTNMTVEDAARSSPTNSTVWKRFFERNGVTWPDGSEVHYLPDPGILVVQNTTNNLNRIGTVLKNLSENAP